MYICIYIIIWHHSNVFLNNKNTWQIQKNHHRKRQNYHLSAVSTSPGRPGGHIKVLQPPTTTTARHELCWVDLLSYPNGYTIAVWMVWCWPWIMSCHFWECESVTLEYCMVTWSLKAKGWEVPGDRLLTWQSDSGTNLTQFPITTLKFLLQ